MVRITSWLAAIKRRAVLNAAFNLSADVHTAKPYYASPALVFLLDVAGKVYSAHFKKC